MSPSNYPTHNIEYYSSDSPWRRRPSKKYGRTFVLLLFIWLRIVDLLLLFLICPRLPELVKQELILVLVTAGAWTSGLLAAIWFRQNWARYLLSGSLLLAMLVSIALLPCLRDAANPKKDLLFILGFTAIYLPVSVVALASRDLRRLTEERNETL